MRGGRETGLGGIRAPIETIKMDKGTGEMTKGRKLSEEDKQGLGVVRESGGGAGVRGHLKTRN